MKMEKLAPFILLKLVFDCHRFTPISVKLVKETVTCIKRINPGILTFAI